jgi:hypothetical protein
MSSATYSQPGPVRRLLQGIAARMSTSIKADETAAKTNDRIARLGLSPRQQILNHLWSWYRCEKYSGRKVDWNGGQALDPIEHEAIATQGFLPPGFFDAGQMMPVKFRKPTAPYALTRVIVDRFTGLLFSEKRHPFIKVDGDEQTDEYVGALIESGRLWATMIQARSYGGAMGTVAIGFQFVDGRIQFESHDPRWTVPTFIDRQSMKLKSIEKRYMYPVEERDETGVFRTEWYWYRRIIDESVDILYAPAPVGEGDEPDWVVQSEVEHNLGFCPVVWVQNLPLQDDIDGDPDCLGGYEMIEAVDALLAQANKGILANCDPTLVLTSDSEMAEIRKGSDNALKMDKGGSANYLEMTGSGPKVALEAAETFRRYVLEVTQCILEHPDMSQRTATEIERAYSSMLAKADVLREQYGQKCLAPLIEMVLLAVRQLSKGTISSDTGEIVRQKVTLPPKIVTNESGERQRTEHTLGPGGPVLIVWPHYFEAVLTDVEMATRAATAAQTGGLVDMEHAVRFVAEYFKIEDVYQIIERIKAERKEQQEMTASQTLGALGSSGFPAAGGSFEEIPEQ